MLCIGREEGHAMARSTVSDGALVYRRISLQPGIPTLKALEEAVYASSWLLSDFERVSILVDTPDVTFVPEAFGDDGIMAAASTAQLAGDGRKVLTDKGCRPSTVWSIDEGVHNFLQRTFPTASIAHVLRPLLCYLGSQASRGNRRKIYAHFDSGRRLDIMVYDAAGEPVFVSSKTADNEKDALYYIMATAQTTGFDAEADQLMLCGDSKRRHAVMPLLRRYVRHVMPLIFPSRLANAGHEVFEAPFPLIIMPLCE